MLESDGSPPLDNTSGGLFLFGRPILVDLHRTRSAMHENGYLAVGQDLDGLASQQQSAHTERVLIAKTRSQSDRLVS